MAKDKVYVAKTGFTTTINDTQVSIRRGERVREGHAVLKGRADLFEEAGDNLRFDNVEQATAAPGEKRGQRAEKAEPKAAEQPKPEPDKPEQATAAPGEKRQRAKAAKA